LIIFIFRLIKDIFMSTSKNTQLFPSASQILYGAFKLGVATLALSAGARPLTGRNDQQYPLPHFTDVAVRANCSNALAAATDPVNGKQSFTVRHVTLTGCRHKPVPEDGACTDPIGTRHHGSILLKEPHKTRSDKQSNKIYRNAKTIYDVLSCKQTIDKIKKSLKNEGIDIKKTPGLYEERLSAEIIQIINDRQLKMDGVSLIFEDGVKGQEKCLSISTRRKGFNAPQVAILLDAKTCQVKGIHPMIKEIPCVDLCKESERLRKKHESNGGGGGGIGGQGTAK
jgi:hypothetical protein